MEMELSQETLDNWCNIIDKEEERRNTITQQEFEIILPLYKKELLDELDSNTINKMISYFQVRFNMYKKITVVDSLGKTIIELSPSLLSPDLWNTVTNVDLGDAYRKAIEQETPFNVDDIDIIRQMSKSIEASKNMDRIKEFFLNRVIIEKEYFNLNIDATNPPDDEKINPEENVDFKMNTDGMF